MDLQSVIYALYSHAMKHHTYICTGTYPHALPSTSIHTHTHTHTHTTDNDDFVPVTRVLSFDSFTTEQSITISIINDNQVEVNEEFNIRVVTEEEDSSNIIVSPDEAVVTIVDTDR